MAQGGDAWYVGGSLVILDGATYTLAETFTITLGADEYVKIDASTPQLTP